MVMAFTFPTYSSSAVAFFDLTQHPVILLMPGIVNSAFDENQAVNILIITGC